MGILHGYFTFSEAKRRFSGASSKSVNYFCGDMKDAPTCFIFHFIRA